MSRPRTLLTEEQVTALKAAYLACKDGPTRARFQAVRLYGQGYSVPEIQQICPCSRSSLMGWCHDFHQGGADALRDQRKGGNRAKLTPEQRRSVRERLHRYTPGQLLGEGAATSSGQFWTVPDLARALQQWFGVTFDSPTSYATLLAACGLSYQRARKLYRSRREGQVMDFEERLEKN